MDNDQGVIYVSTGEKYVEMTARSARSLKTHCPNLPIHIFTDRDISSYGCFDSSTIISDPKRRYGAKVDYFHETPYQNTLFLDADTRVCEDISDMFDLLDRFDIAIAHAFERARQWYKYNGPAPKIFSPLNSGVILYKKTDPVVEFFKSWQKAYHEDGRVADQMTLREQLWESDINLLVLPPEYNIRPKCELWALRSAEIKPKILHIDDFKREVGIMPEYYSLPLRKRLRTKLKHFINGQLRYRFK